MLVSHKRPGFYLRVIEEGEVGAGDEIVKVLEGPERVTVAEANALLYLPGRLHDRLLRVVRVPALSPGWKSSFENLLACEFRAVRVATIERESADVLSFTLEAEDRRPLSPHLPGQFLVFRLEPEGAKAPLLRSYSISGPQNAGTYRISVKRERGPGSHYLHDQMQAGDLLQVSVPKGSFTLMPGKHPIVLLGAGIGATPLLSMLYWLAASSEDFEREVWWCRGARNQEEHLFRVELQGLLQSLPNSRSFIAYSKPGEGQRQGVDYDVAGHLSLASLQELQVPQSADFYFCGPPALLGGITEELSAWGVPNSRIHAEAFGAGAASTAGIAGATSRKPHLPDENVGTGPNVSFTRSGFSVPWHSRFKSLLELAEACNIPVTWSCRTGVCHACESELLGGVVLYAPEPLEHPANGNALICCATPLTPTQVDI